MTFMERQWKEDTARILRFRPERSSSPKSRCWHWLVVFFSSTSIWLFISIGSCMASWEVPVPIFRQRCLESAPPSTRCHSRVDSCTRRHTDWALSVTIKSISLFKRAVSTLVLEDCRAPWRWWVCYAIRLHMSEPSPCRIKKSKLNVHLNWYTICLKWKWMTFHYSTNTKSEPQRDIQCW